MEPLFKVGDRVRIVKRRLPSYSYKYVFSDEMAKLEGNIYTISSITEKDNTLYLPIHDDDCKYELSEYPARCFTWSSGMFEAVNKAGVTEDNSNTIKLKKLCRIKLKFTL